MSKSTTTATININTSNHDNNLLLPKTPINSVFSPTFNDVKMYDSMIDTIVYNDIHGKIARHCLNKLYSKGNMNAYEILTHGTAIIDIDDVRSEILVAIIENIDDIAIIDGVLTITSDNAIKAVYGACSRFMYQFMQKHYKHVYTVIDGQEIDIFNVKALASYADFDDIESMSLYQSFLSVVMSVYPKDYKRIETIVKMRINGATFTECAKKLHCNVSTITRLQSKISECAKMLYR
ncbi:hypothetical protein [Butyrivibrio sp. INlla21]|uniref:hypothetical protein n=1 Tax=Butyrivibrio sp. INlla21 TaxID=1520811 RepID=UPI0008E8A3E0|nr:hypothetical protein [Butyrivibrio sp. INlla21]SFU36654.1 hypothetical protein SAMN02910342_00267 [Butyrivibrio sp. INlla21]